MVARVRLPERRVRPRRMPARTGPETAAWRPGRAALSLLLVLGAGGGCGRHSSGDGENRRGPTVSAGAEEDQLILSLADNLNHLEEFEADQILPQIRHRLDQWVEQKKPQVDWQPDPLVETLPEPLRKVARWPPWTRKNSTTSTCSICARPSGCATWPDTRAATSLTICRLRGSCSTGRFAICSWKMRWPHRSTRPAIRLRDSAIGPGHGQRVRLDLHPAIAPTGPGRSGARRARPANAPIPDLGSRAGDRPGLVRVRCGIGAAACRSRGPAGGHPGRIGRRRHPAAQAGHELRSASIRLKRAS